MANPQDPGTFENWITNRITFEDIPPKLGDTGDFEKWITNRIYWQDYVESALVVRTPRYGFTNFQVPGIV